MNTYEEANLIITEFYNQDRLKQEFIDIKQKHKEVMALIDEMPIGEDRRKLLVIREHYRMRMNLISNIIEDERWLYSNLT